MSDTTTKPTQDFSALDGIFQLGKKNLYKPGQLLAIELFRMRTICAIKNLSLAKTDVVMMSYILGSGNLESAFNRYKESLEAEINQSHIPSLAPPTPPSPEPAKDQPIGIPPSH